MNNNHKYLYCIQYRTGDEQTHIVHTWFETHPDDGVVKGKHPPCGRKDADGKSYPKCRPSKKVSKETPKIASSYDKEDKKKMTQQKRRAEKKDPKIGKGNKPISNSEGWSVIVMMIDQ